MVFLAGRPPNIANIGSFTVHIYGIVGSETTIYSTIIYDVKLKVKAHAGKHQRALRKGSQLVLTYICLALSRYSNCLSNNAVRV